MALYTFVKNTVGSVSFNLESYDFSLPTKTFEFQYNVDRILVPQQYALGLFVSSDALNMFRQGIFTVEKFEDLEKLAQEMGLTAESAESHACPVADISKALNSGDEAFIDKILNGHNAVDLNNLVILTRASLDTLPGGIISKIEQACGVELRIE